MSNQRNVEVGLRRLDLLLAGNSIGVAPEGMDDLLRQTDDQVERLKGVASILRFIGAIRSLAVVVAASTTKPSSFDDSFLGADVWTTLVTSEGRFALVGVQVKSSDYYLSEFVRESGGWEKLKTQGLVVLNAGEVMERKKVQRAYLRQVREIGRLNNWKLATDGLFKGMKKGEKIRR